MVIKTLYVVKFKGETLDKALSKCGGLKGCFRTPEEALLSAEQAGFRLTEIRIVRITYETLKSLDHLIGK